MVKLGGILFFIDLIIGLYLINKGLNNFIILPNFFVSIDNGIILLGGILIIISGIISMRQRTYS